MYGHDLAIAFVLLFIPAFLGSMRDAGLGNLRVIKTREKKG
jgi:hypothetical protein